VNIVVDASVALKWFFQLNDDEVHVDQALALLRCIDEGSCQMIQPPHFLAEMAAVLARKKSALAEQDITDLLDLDAHFIEDRIIYPSAIDLSVRLQHHLFDTLYHATALHHPNTTLLTADLRYYEKARSVGNIQLISSFTL
jgi:predicted nucleic acid-binding protein